MATVGRLKSKIDVLKKKMAGKGTADKLQARRLRKRLKRLQRARRTATVAETRAKPKAPVAEGATAPAEPPPQA